MMYWMFGAWFLFDFIAWVVFYGRARRRISTMEKALHASVNPAWHRSVPWAPGGPLAVDISHYQGGDDEEEGDS